MRALLRVANFAGLLLLVSLVFVSAQPEQGAAAGHSSLYYLLQAAISLAIVVGLIYAIYFGLRRLSQTTPTDKGDALRLVASRHLGGGRWVYILEVADRILIVGGGSEGLRKLAEFPADEFDQSQSGSDRKGAAGNDISH